MERDRGEIWFVQERRFQRGYAVHWKGWVFGLLFIVAFFGIAALFISLNPFQPLNYGLLLLWWLSVLALMAVSHVLARPRTERRWEQGARDS
jgi:membrane protein implicated in regulation of membrane protease activity